MSTVQPSPAEGPRIPRRARSFRGLLLVLVPGALGIAAVCGVAWLLRDPTPRMLERRSALASVEEGAVIKADSHFIQIIRVRGTSGLAVNLTVKRHVADSTGRYPLALLLGGHRTGQDAVRLLENTRGAVAAAVSYPYVGDPRPYAGDFLRAIPRIRTAFLDTPPALMLALDYLLGRSDVDGSRVEGVGVSLGAPFMVIAGALDQRISRIWVVHGSGGSFTPLQHNMRAAIPFAPLRYFGAGLATVILSGPRLAPERWVARTSPRPFIMVNARDDQRMPAAAVHMLFEAASEPKEMIWTPGTHVRSSRDVVRPLVDTLLARIALPAETE